MFSQEKGITPVIAIVLLLLITVGAVGVVYTQFQDLTSGNDAQEDLQSQQRLQSSSYKIIGVSKDGSSPGTVSVTVKNTGDVTLDLSQVATMQIGKSEGNPQAVSVLAGSGCTWGTTSPSPGESSTCSTSVEWVGSSSYTDGRLERFELLIDDIKKDTYSCDMDTNYC